MIRHIPRAVFVPFEFDPVTQKWYKRDDLPRFREAEEPIQFWLANPSVLYRNGEPLRLVWQERDERVLIEEFLQGVGTLEY